MADRWNDTIRVKSVIGARSFGGNVCALPTLGCDRHRERRLTAYA
jgi:hypothetical protein